MTSSGSLEGVFSFDTPQAVMHVLASVRKSEIAPKDKNNLRDLVLAYTNGGKDPSLKIQIEQLLNSLAVQPLPKTSGSTVATSAPLDFGSSRNTPAFTAPAVTVAATPVAPVQPVVPAPPAPVPVVPVQPVAAAPAPVVAQPVVPPAPAPQPPVAAPATPVVPAPQAAPVMDNSAALARVREIKSLVNEKIGNPVNLVDIDNAVGREYMSALLDAMKKLSSGVNSASTMERLETAYASVERVLESPQAAAVVPEPVVPLVQSAPPVPAPVAQPPVQPLSATPQPAPKPVEPVPVREPEPVTPVEESKQPEVVERPEPVAQKRATTPIQDDRWSAATAVIKPAPMKPLSESAEPLKSVNDVPTQDSLTNKNDDPLQSAEVTDGLNQLLSDWVLFKKSGLFGTGPKGIEHPLYKNIKELQIPLLLAGRFEGATQEIKQSITDYMNGWRYEQGIIYEQGETFDHYLRRVIRHILDLQK